MGGDFKAQLGDPGNPGLLSQAERLARLRIGQNPYVTGPALPGNSPVFSGAPRSCTKSLEASAIPTNPVA